MKADNNLWPYLDGMKAATTPEEDLKTKAEHLKEVLRYFENTSNGSVYPDNGSQYADQVSAQPKAPAPKSAKNSTKAKSIKFKAETSLQLCEKLYEQILSSSVMESEAGALLVQMVSMQIDTLKLIIASLSADSQDGA